MADMDAIHDSCTRQTLSTEPAISSNSGETGLDFGPADYDRA
jgi:hypothetical protein